MKRLLLKVLCVLGYHDPEIKYRVREARPGERPGLYRWHKIVCRHCEKELTGK